MAITAKIQQARISNIPRTEDEWKEICIKIYTPATENTSAKYFVPAVGEKIVFCDDSEERNLINYCIGDGITPLFILRTELQDNETSIDKNIKENWITSEGDNKALPRSQTMAPVSIYATEGAPDYLHQKTPDTDLTDLEHQIATEDEITALHTEGSLLDKRLDLLEETLNEIANIGAFQGIVESIPPPPGDYNPGDTVYLKELYIDKEPGYYMFNNDETWEPIPVNLSSIPILAERISNLEDEVLGGEEGIFTNSRIDKNEKAIEDMFDDEDKIKENILPPLPVATPYNSCRDQGSFGTVRPDSTWGISAKNGNLRLALYPDTWSREGLEFIISDSINYEPTDGNWWRTHLPIVTGNYGYFAKYYLDTKGYKTAIELNTDAEEGSLNKRLTAIEELNLTNSGTAANAIVDYVIEQKIDNKINDWDYTIWNSGKIEFWGNFKIQSYIPSIQNDASHGVVKPEESDWIDKDTDEKTTILFPNKIFKKIPIGNVSNKLTGHIMILFGDITNKGCSFYFNNPHGSNLDLEKNKGSILLHFIGQLVNNTEEIIP